MVQNAGAVVAGKQRIEKNRKLEVTPRKYDDRTWKRLEGRTVFVAGGASGMGAAEAKLFAAEGANVVVADINDTKARDVAGAIGHQAIAVHLDVQDERSWADAVRGAQSRFGSIDGLVNNAGIGASGLIEDTSYDEFMRIIRINLGGMWLGIKACTPAMRKAGGGAIVSVSSIEGLVAHPAFSVYAASKAGILGMTRAAALELAPSSIRVNAICPGVIDTPMVRPEGIDRSVLAGLESGVPLGRAGEAHEIALSALFLVSDDSRYVTGTTVIVDGGATAQNPLPL